MSGSRYFLEAEPTLAAKLERFLARLAADLGAQSFSQGVAALVLGGGYGRGEGGVFRATKSGEAQLYNDLEFFIFSTSRAIATPLTAWCHRWEHQGTRELGIDVEFKQLPAGVFATAVPTMFYFDLLQGHQLVWGDPKILSNAPATLRHPTQIPLSEPVRLLFNRGSGLLFARWRLEEQPDDPDGFVERNHAKARLALADAVLAAAGLHDGSCLERSRRIAAANFFKPPFFAQLQEWHTQGVQFKLQPRHLHPGAAALADENRELTAVWLEVFLWLESRRLGKAIKNGADYLALSGRLFPHSSRLRNFSLHVRDLMRRGLALPGWLDYPRAALQRALVAAHSVDLSEAAAARCVSESRRSWRISYRRWWGLYN